MKTTVGSRSKKGRAWRTWQSAAAIAWQPRTQYTVVCPVKYIHLMNRYMIPEPRQQLGHCACHPRYWRIYNHCIPAATPNGGCKGEEAKKKPMRLTGLPRPRLRARPKHHACARGCTLAVVRGGLTYLSTKYIDCPWASAGWTAVPCRLPSRHPTRLESLDVEMSCCFKTVRCRPRLPVLALATACASAVECDPCAHPAGAGMAWAV